MFTSKRTIGGCSQWNTCTHFQRTYRKKGVDVPKWSEKLALVIILWLFFRHICLINVNFWRVLIKKKFFVAIFSDACALTPRKCFAEERKNVRKWSEKHKLFWSHSFVFAFKILASEIIIFWLFLYLNESLVATFSEKLAHTSRKYFVDQGMGVVKWSEDHKFRWLHSYIFIFLF